jgi:hypothetical protein
MAISEYCVVCPQSSGKRMSGLRTWNGAAAGAGIDDLNIKEAKYLIVSAESNAEAVKGVQQLYGTMVAEKAFVIKKSLGEELG